VAFDGSTTTETGPATEADLLDEIERLYEAGRVFDALQLGESRQGPIRTWVGPRSLVLGGRIAMNLGAPRLGRMLQLRAARLHPDDPLAAYYHARAILERRGPLALIEHVRQVGILPSTPTDVRADWLSLQATAHAAFRDFATADRLLAQSLELDPDRPWTQVEQAWIHEQADRYDQAMASARRALELQPWMRPAVQATAHLLQVADRDRDALALLTEAAGRLQNVPLLQQLAALQDHLRLYPDALATLARLDRFTPFHERRFDRGLAWVRSNVLYHAGDHAGAIAAAEGSDDEWVRNIAVTLRAQVDAGGARPRVRLDVPFVRQHHMTCAPATLTAVSRFWGRPADHLELVEAICYDGTPSYNQRDWAVTHGWVAREFRLTWDVAVALVDRGVPFTLATVGIGSSHLQAVVGYDPMRGTILCRDPSQYYETEMSVDPLLRYNAAFGPHCMVMVPPGEAHRLDGLDLPDADLHDALLVVVGALARHDRATAASARDRIAAAAPDHRLAASADRALAAYDRDAQGSLSAVDRLLAQFPDSRPLRLSRTLDLRALGHRDELLRGLADACGRADADPVFLHLYAEHLRSEGRPAESIEPLLRRALRRRPNHPASLSLLGHVRWDQRRFDEATDLYRLTACADDKNEQPARSYFIATRHRGRVDEAMAMLAWRFERSGRRSGQPGCTLSWAHEQLDQVAEAIAVLDRARGLRPDDGDLLLHAVDLYGRRADLPRATELLALAKDKTRPADWLRASARLSEIAGDLAAATAGWRAVLDTEPAADDANMAVARLVAMTESPAAAAAFLAGACDRFPHRASLHEHRIAWLRQVGAAAVVEAATQLVERQPHNLWARVERSLALSQVGRATEALDEAGRAMALAPTAPNALLATGRALERLGRFAEARDHFRRSVGSSVEYTAGIQALVDACPDDAAIAAELEFVAGLFDLKGLFGDGLSAFAGHATRVWPHDRLDRFLADAIAARPDVWQTWSARARFLRDVNRPDDAAAVARAMVDRFSLLPRAWLDLAGIEAARGDRDAQVAALRRCLDLSPGWSWPARQLATALRRGGDLPGAIAVLRSALTRDPLDAPTHDALAHLLWTAGDRPAAIESVRRALSIDPWLSEAWSALGDWSRATGDADAVVRLARDLCGRRGGEAVAWLVLARSLSGPAALAEQLEACDRAIALAPTNSDAHDLRAVLLAGAGRHDEALAACDPPPFAGQPPVELRGRAAWLRAERGDRAAAITAMREVVDRNPRYEWGWGRLLGWLDKAGDASAYLAAAADMVDRFPNHPLARNHLAHAQLACNDRPAARATLERSALLRPEDGYVLDQLFTLQLADRDDPAAAATLDLARRHLSPARAATYGVRLASAKRDAAAAAEALAVLCKRTDVDDPAAVANAVETMTKAQLGATVDRVLIDVVSAGGHVNPEAAAVRVKRLTAKRRWSAAARALGRFDPDSAPWRAAVIPFLEAQGEANRAWPLLRFVRRNDAPLRRVGRTWGAVTYALTRARRHAACARFCHDWRGRTDLQPWMLMNLATAYRRTRRPALATEVSAHAVTLRDDGNRLKHLTWVAVTDVLAGRAGPAVTEVAGSDEKALAQHYVFLRAVVRSLAPLSAGEVTPDAAAAARHQLTAAHRKHRKLRNPDIAWVYRRAARRIARARPTFFNRVWAAWTWATTPTHA
jgi:tetratricopeptide (TPR) repeat protein